MPPTTAQTQRRRKHHSWDSSGADYHRILESLNYSWSNRCDACEQFSDRLIKKLTRWYQPFPVFIGVYHNNNSNNATPSPPPPSQPMLWMSKKITETIAKGAGPRFQSVLPYLQESLQQLTQKKNKHHLYPNLVRALKQFGLLPFYVDYGDYTGCPDPKSKNKMDEMKHTIGLPYLSICKSTICKFGFPMPTFTDYEVAVLGVATNSSDGSTSTSIPWVSQMNEWNRTYPWKDKIPKAYWRGGIKNERQQMMDRANSHPEYSEFLDVKESSRRKKHPKEYSMKYKAVIDIDGNSWSERFPRLLCYNSAVILITNQKEDYEEYLVQDLIPNVHYIPATVDNFTEVARDLLLIGGTSGTVAMHEDKENFLKSIVQNANQFCRERLTVEGLNSDFLSLLDGYYSTLNQFHSNWIKEWEMIHHQYVGPGLGHGGFTTNSGGSMEDRTDLINPSKWK